MLARRPEQRRSVHQTCHHGTPHSRGFLGQLNFLKRGRRRVFVCQSSVCVYCESEKAHTNVTDVHTWSLIWVTCSAHVHAHGRRAPTVFLCGGWKGRSAAVPLQRFPLVIVPWPRTPCLGLPHACLDRGGSAAQGEPVRVDFPMQRRRRPERGHGVRNRAA